MLQFYADLSLSHPWSDANQLAERSIRKWKVTCSNPVGGTESFFLQSSPSTAQHTQQEFPYKIHNSNFFPLFPSLGVSARYLDRIKGSLATCPVELRYPEGPGMMAIGLLWCIEFEQAHVDISGFWLIQIVMVSSEIWCIFSDTFALA